jgi:hypothetical protein
MKVDRDQTAERVHYQGIAAVDEALSALERVEGGAPSGNGRDRLIEDKIGMLVSLRTLHQRYKAVDKLGKVEAMLREAGYER